MGADGWGRELIDKGGEVIEEGGMET